MKKLRISCALLLALLMLCSGFTTLAETSAGAPKLVAHYTFFDANDVGKDSAGTQNLTVQGASIGTDGTAKQVDGPLNGMKALEFDQTYSLMSAADDIFDHMKEFTITYLVAANSEGKLEKNVFSTGAGNGNSFKNAGFNMLIDRETGSPDVRLFGGDREISAQKDGSKWDVNQRKNDDKANGKTFFSQRVQYTPGENPDYTAYTYEADEWYRVVLTVKLSDGTQAGEETAWPVGEKYIPGTGVQSVYIEKMNGVVDKGSLTEGKNYYTTALPYHLTDLANETHGFLIGNAYMVNKENPTVETALGKNYSPFVGRLADFRVYDKALTQDQIVELYTTNDLSDKSAEDGGASEPDHGENQGPSAGVDMNWIPVVTALPAAATMACSLVLRKRKISK